jgi:hypothetical protein
MSVKLNLKKKLIAGLMLSGSVAAAMAADPLAKNGTEYPLFPTLPLDQVMPHLSIGTGGGYIVSQDAIVDGNGLGLRARRLNPDLSAGGSTFGVNSITSGDQQNGRVAVLPNGGAVFVWQSSTAQGHKIYARFMGPDQQFVGAEVQASDRMFGHQSDPAVAALADGTVVVVWAELNRDNLTDRMSGIFGQRFNSGGQKIGGTFMVNTVTPLNQRTPVIAALENGGFVVAWVSDEFRQRPSEYIDIAARLFDAAGNPIGQDFALNSSANLCANPALTATTGGFRAGWSTRYSLAPQFVRSETVEGVETDVVVPVGEASIESWDVATRVFDLQGSPAGAEVIVNNIRKGDQYSPRLANLGGKELILWTSYGQDRSDEGIYGRVISGSDFAGAEFLVNTHTRLKQMFPAAAVVGDRVLVAWSSFISASAGFDIRAQQFSIAASDSLAKPANPFAFALGPNSISVSWAEIGGQEIDAYRIYVDGEVAPIETSAGMLTVTRPEWTARSVHTVRLSYRLKSGQVSPISDGVTVTTWGADQNGDSVPDEWQTENWGKEVNWPLASADSDGDGASNLAEFLAGTDPTDSASVLKVEISPREQGLYLQWRTTPGSYYQLQATSDFAAWTNVGPARFAPSTSDSLPVEGPGQPKYYRVILMR